MWQHVRNSLAVAICVTGTLAAQVQTADVILTGGKVVTVDNQFRVAQAVAIRGDRIVAVGTDREMAALAGPATRRLDLRGRTVVPGLIDNHMHLLRAVATWTREVRLDGVVSRKQAIAMLQAKAKALGAGEWVYTMGGWTHHQFADDPKPFSKQELDQIAPANPVALQESYYQFILNSRALQMFGIQAGVADPPDFIKGTIQRDASGAPTGIVMGDIAATRPVQARLPKVPAAEMEASARALMQDMNRAGITSFGVPGCDAETLAIFQKWKREEHLGIRIFCMIGNAASTPEQVDRALPQIAQMKLFQGDNFIDDIAFGESVYSPLHDPMFATSSDPPAEQLAQWRRMALAIAKAGLPLHVHAELHNTIDAFLDQIESINKEHPIKNLRWMLAHVNQINAAQLERMKRLGMMAAVHPWAVINGGIMREGFGEGALELPPLRTIQNSGILWGLGTDGSAANQYLPFTTLAFAVTGQMAGGAPAIRETVSREDALIAHTRNNAYFIFQESNLGSIQPGKLADLVVLDRDYLTVPANQIRDIKPVMTISGGRIVFEAGSR